RLVRLLSIEQMKALLDAPAAEAATDAKKPGRPVDRTVAARDTAILEAIYSCGLRIAELCGLRVEDLEEREALARVRGKGRKERIVPVGSHAMRAIHAYWQSLDKRPTTGQPAFWRGADD